MFNYTTSTTPGWQCLGDQTQHQRHLREQPSSTSCKTSGLYCTESHLGTLTVPIADWLPWNDLECTSAATCASSTGVSAPSLASNSVLKAFWVVQEVSQTTGRFLSQECLPTQKYRRPKGPILPFCAWVVLFFLQHAHQHPEMCQKDPEGKEFFYRAMVESRHMGNGHPMSSLCWTNKCFKQIRGWNDHHPLW